MIWIGTAAAFLVSAWLTYRFLRPRSVFHILDQPNPRSLHVRAVPRSGGVAIVTGVGVAAIFTRLDQTLPAAAAGLVAGWLLITLISFVEDRWGVAAPVRLLFHCLAALLLVRGGLSLATVHVPGLVVVWPTWLATSATLLFVAWMINLYNFMDGMDGLAGGMAVFGFGAYAILGYRAGDPVFMTASLIVAAAAAGFLVFNFPPARCFMGDTGSSTLGFLAAAFALWGSYQWIIPIWISLLVFSPFVVDATVTLLRRIVTRKRFWEAHDTHYYQRLIRAGWTHRRTIIAAYGLMAYCALAAAVALHAPVPGRWAVLLVVACTYLALIRAVGRVEERARLAPLPDRNQGQPPERDARHQMHLARSRSAQRRRSEPQSS
jgi:UDP-N-acetylmuramyl pentapeptide phosphotransferase/UDP-N-acetylglucosamine-1-phosphate transferase